MLNDYFTLEERYREAWEQLTYSNKSNTINIPIGISPEQVKELYVLFQGKCNPIFEKSINRFVMGSMRYNILGLNVNPKYDLVKSIGMKLRLYIDSGNQENLIDLINYAILEIINKQHPNSHFESMDDSIHAIIK